MKLATFNLESFGSDRLDESSLEPRIKALKPRIEELQADILCLQEVNAQKPRGDKRRCYQALDALLSGTIYEAYFRASSQRPSGKGPGDRHNLVVLSKHPIRQSQSLYSTYANPLLWHPKTADPAFEEPQTVTFERPILSTEIDIGQEKSLHLFTVHLRAPIAAMIPGGKNPDRSWKSLSAWAEGYQLSVLKQISQALELRLSVDALLENDHEANIVVTGDFNATGEAGTLRLLRADPDDTGSPALAHKRLYQLDASLPPGERQTVLHKGKGQALDHILASAALTSRVVDVRVFNEALPDEIFDAADTDYGGSYHAAMRAEFDFAN